MKTRNVVSVSGGKDSTATYLLALEKTDGDFEAVFADTGNEHEATYEYMARLSERTGGPKVQTVRADFSRELERRRIYLESGKPISRTKNPWTTKRVKEVLAAGFAPSGVPFLDLCRAKGMFPSRKKAFCSQFLKRIPIFEQFFSPLLERGFAIVNWQGIRAEESQRRACYPMREISPESEDMSIYRPIIGWTVADVAAIHQRHGLKLNPLYGLGFSRVGCLPCIQSKKHDLRLIFQKFPDHIAKIKRWEKAVGAASRVGYASFFHFDKTGSDVSSFVDAVIRWSLTRHGGRQFDMLALLEPVASEVCIYAGGLCE